MQAMTMLFFAVVTFLLGVVAQATLGLAGTAGYSNDLLRGFAALVTMVGPVLFLIGALVVSRSPSADQ